MKSLFLFSFLALSTTLTYAQATANQPADLAICDDFPFDGMEAFDLTVTESEILGTQDPASYDVAFFLTQIDADSNTNPIVNETMYVNSSNPQQLYARVTNISNADFDVTDFQLIVLDVPNVFAPSPLEVCDDDNDGFAIFDLTLKDAEIVAGDPELVVTYHENFTDAASGINALASPYQNISAFLQIIYIRVENMNTGCVALLDMDIVVFETPEPTQPNNIYINEGDGDGMAIFDLTVNDEILADGIANAQISYYETVADAQALNNAITNPEAYPNTSNPQQLYASAQNGDTSCYAVVSFIIATDETGLPDNDNDLVPDAIEDTNANGDLTDDDTDDDTIPNFQDDDDDGDGTRTADEDYNSNGSPTDDDTNANRIPDYLDPAVTLGVSEFSSANIQVYPNPATNNLLVALESMPAPLRMAVNSIHGKTIFSDMLHTTNAFKLDVSSYASGVYFITIASEKGTATLKFIKK